MSKAGSYLKTAISMVTSLEEGKPHSSITDWIEVLSSDRYEELSLDGISELVDSVNILGPQGTTVSFLPLYDFTLVDSLRTSFSCRKLRVLSGRSLSTVTSIVKSERLSFFELSQRMRARGSSSTGPMSS